jgi:acyl-coenzyme A synthetase/AMP-(fatty) acid ligase
MKAPELIAVVDELPRNASGKVKKHVLRESVDFASISR